MNFKDLNINETIKTNIKNCKYDKQTKVQQMVIPLILNNQDVLTIAQTGSGKTAAYLIPIIEKLSKNTSTKGIKCIILAPTRDLVNQIYETWLNLSKNLNLTAMKVMGGVNKQEQKDKIKSQPNVLIAVTGRLKEFINKDLISFNFFEMLVIDEVDKMLDMGFRSDILNILQVIRNKKTDIQTLMFSATLPKSINELIKKILKPNYQKVKIQEELVINDLIKQKMLIMQKSHMLTVLLKIIFENNQQTLIFTNTINECINIENLLRLLGLNCCAIHGDRTQSYRDKIINDFKNQKISILIATDVLSRGIDIKELDLIINYGLPESLETYMHRIGRVGRANNKGRSITICSLSSEQKVQTLINNYGLNIQIISKDEWKLKNQENIKDTINLYYNKIR